MTHSLRKAAALMIATLALAACTPSDPAGPYHEWFNPDGVKASAPVPDVCAPGEVPGLPAATPPLTVPPVVAEGYSFATFDLRVEALVMRSEGGNPVDDLCLPVAIHAYINVAGTAAPITTAEQGIVTTPWDALRNTPYNATGLVAWRNTLPSGPVMNIDWSAKYEATIDPTDRGDQIIGLACTVYMNGIVISRTISIDVNRPSAPLPDAQGGQAVTGPFVQCRPPAFTPRAAL